MERSCPASLSVLTAQVSPQSAILDGSGGAPEVYQQDSSTFLQNVRRRHSILILRAQTRNADWRGSRWVRRPTLSSAALRSKKIERCAHKKYLQRIAQQHNVDDAQYEARSENHALIGTTVVHFRAYGIKTLAQAFISVDWMYYCERHCWVRITEKAGWFFWV